MAKIGCRYQLPIKNSAGRTLETLSVTVTRQRAGHTSETPV